MKTLLVLLALSLTPLLSSLYGQTVASQTKISDALEKQYWALKQKNLKERELYKEKIETASQKISMQYSKKNGLTEELYLLKDQLRQVELKVEENKNKRNEFEDRLVKSIEDERKKLENGFPYLLPVMIPELNELERSVKNESLLKTIERFIKYKKQVLSEGESIVFANKIYIDTKNDSRILAPTIRVGFVGEMYYSKEQSGLLLRKTGLKGIFYEWDTDLPEGLTARVSESVSRLINQKDQKEGVVEIGIDPNQSGKRMRGFQKTGSAGIVQAFVTFFINGGVIMWPLLALGIFGIILMTERGLYYYRHTNKKDLNFEKVYQLLKEDQHKEAVTLLKENKSIYASIILPVVKKKSVSRDDAERIMDERIVLVTPQLEKRLPTLAVLAAVAPLLGLLGTVSGMIQLFDVITLYGTSNPAILAGGISIALITTQAGLALAIPIMLTHHVFIRTKNAVVNDMEKVVIETLSNMYPDQN